MRKILDNKNKRGDIPITILVIGVLVVCTLAILSFIKSDIEVKKSFSGVDVLEKANMNIERGNLESYYLDKKVRVFSPSLSSKWFKTKIIFSVRYESEYTPD